MKRNKTIYNITITLLSLLILAYSTVLQFSTSSFVLCFGDDGHIAFEQSDENYQCGDLDDNKDHPLNKHKNLSHQEDDCNDLQLLNILTTLFLEKDGKTKIAKLTVIDATVDILQVHFLSKSEIHNSYNIIQPSMKSLQATILLI
jgi:hypothetical protein